MQASNEETKEHLYETLLAECRDTIQAVREELKSEAVRATTLKLLYFGDVFMSSMVANGSESSV